MAYLFRYPFVKICILMISFLLFCGCNATPADKEQKGFSAEMQATMSGITSRAKVMAEDNKYRLEIIGGRRASVMIARYDEGLLWLLVPEDKKYKEMSVEAVKEDLPEFFRRETLIEKEEVGREILEKVSAIKYKTVVTSVNNKKYKGYLWEAESLPGYPLKWEDPDTGLVVVWKNGRPTNLPDFIFELPKGYTEL